MPSPRRCWSSASPYPPLILSPPRSRCRTLSGGHSAPSRSRRCGRRLGQWRGSWTTTPIGRGDPPGVVHASPSLDSDPFQNRRDTLTPTNTLRGQRITTASSVGSWLRPTLPEPTARASPWSGFSAAASPSDIRSVRITTKAAALLPYSHCRPSWIAQVIWRAT